MKQGTRRLYAVGIIFASACTVGSPGATTPQPTVVVTQAPLQGPADGIANAADLTAVRTYIKNSWRTLRRSNHDLLKAAVDPKHPPANGKWPVYVAARENLETVRHDLLLTLPMSDMDHLDLRQLGNALPTEHGILYVPHPYVVPGGRFNEMYGWDSYFIMIGLLRDNEIDLAKDMTDNLLYEVKYYGSVLNANRSYYLTRSQPPFLSAMVLEIYARTQDRAWLQEALPVLEKYYRYWTTAPHLTATGLSRFYDTGRGPAPEVMSGEADTHGEGAYQRAKAYYKTHVVNAYDATQFYDSKHDALTETFYQGDRSMRESGYDPSGRFGPFNVGVISYNPVCLNTLLYMMEKQVGEIQKLTGHPDKQAAWDTRAEERKKLINALNWDEKAGLYFDYNFDTKQRHPYPFATTFFPLWTGIASPEQAARIVEHLPEFEAAGGILTSTRVTGNQWDAPYGWAPLNQIAVLGLRRYGFNQQADRISINFLSMVLSDFMHHHAIFEKYDVEHRASDVSRGLKFGYTSNEVGFGWTNGAFEDLYLGLPAAERGKILEMAGVPIPPHPAPNDHDAP